MVDITLLRILIKTVKFLRLAYGSKRCNRKHLSLTAGKHTRTVCAGQKVYLCVKRTNFIKSSAVYTLALVKKPAANDVFL